MSGNEGGHVQVEQSTLEYILHTLRSLDEAIRGNGKPGLRQDVSSLNERFTECQRRHTEEVQQQQQRQDRWWDRMIQPALNLLYKGAVILLVAGAIAVFGHNRATEEQRIRTIVEEIQEGVGGHTQK